MSNRFLYESLTDFFDMGGEKQNIPAYLTDNLNPEFALRPYQEEAFARFFHCLDRPFPNKELPLHFLFHMATGSGKTLIMAGLILYLYQKGFRNFLFFVNSTNIIVKTKENFLNPRSFKHLFNETIRIGANPVTVTPVDNFEGVNNDDINICFTTIQKLHGDLRDVKENALTYEDFKNKKVVLLSDEAHHMNVSTRRQRNLALVESWENTVTRIFKQNKGNLLLEFTATPDYEHKNIVDKYRNKIIYQYDLRQFRNDGYSKDIYLAKSDFPEDDRILQALILNQYKQEVAAKNRINLKPVILFKAKRYIAESEANKANFHKLVDELGVADIERIRGMSDLKPIRQAFAFFDQEGISSSQLVQRLRTEFEESRCISVNREKDEENQQILLNTLEDKDNRIRAIFAVRKLDEGWDVLNLFDIVRCYTGRDARANKPGSTTTAEAQLIGRGARYFPFTTDQHPDRYKRKFDHDATAELRILEELHYHCLHEVRYISELRIALRQEGMVDDEAVIEKSLNLKDSFKETEFYKSGLVYLNERVRNQYEHSHSLSDMGVSSKNYLHRIATGRGTVEAILADNGGNTSVPEPSRRDVPVCSIPVHIIKNALARNALFTFSSLNTFFPHLRSKRQFIEDKAYLRGLSIAFQGDSDTLNPISKKDLFCGMVGLLSQIETELRKSMTEYKGTDSFMPKSIRAIFTNKTLRLAKDSERADGDEEFVADRDWYIFNANYGTSEEKAFVRMIEGQTGWIMQRCNEIYLARNERHFKIYNYRDGEAFEPDFVLFLREKNGNLLTYQMFVEPKGKHLQGHDSWKAQFLHELTERFAEATLDFELRGSTQCYRLIGMPFYNSDNENDFLQEFHEAMSFHG